MSLRWYLSETSSSQLSYGICHLLRQLGTELNKSKEKDKKKSARFGGETEPKIIFPSIHTHNTGIQKYNFSLSTKIAGYSFQSLSF